MPARLTHPKRYSPDERDQALMVLARHGGNAARAVAELAEHYGNERQIPSDESLYRWRNQYSDRYREICEQIAPEIEREAITTYRELVLRSAQGQLTATERTIQELNQGQTKDPAAAAKNLAIAGGVAADKLLVLTGRPTQRIETVDVNTHLERLARALGAPTIDSTAEEVQPAQLESQATPE